MFEFDFLDPISRRIFKKLCGNQGANYITKARYRAFNGLGRVMVWQTQDSIKSGPKTGRIYKLSGRVKRLSGKSLHQASAPGQAPADLTGALRRGVHYTNGGDRLEFGYDADTYYGKWLEKGNKKMDPRPNIQTHGIKGSSIGEQFSYTEISMAMEKWLGTSG